MKKRWGDLTLVQQLTVPIGMMLFALFLYMNRNSVPYYLGIILNAYGFILASLIGATLLYLILKALGKLLFGSSFFDDDWD